MMHLPCIPRSLHLQPCSSDLPASMRDQVLGKPTTKTALRCGANLREGSRMAIRPSAGVAACNLDPDPVPERPTGWQRPEG
jgi:hypothetical protein